LHRGNKPCGLRTEKNTEDSKRSKTELNGNLITSPFINQNRVGMDLNRERQRSGLARIQTRRGTNSRQ